MIIYKKVFALLFSEEYTTDEIDRRNICRFVNEKQAYGGKWIGYWVAESESYKEQEVALCRYSMESF